jgi:gliding motility-associated-like protein
MKKFILLVILAIGFYFPSKATHTVGGEFVYENIAANTYRVTFYLFRDCLNGIPGALKEDETSSFGVYNITTSNWINRFEKNSIAELTPVPNDFVNDCITNAPPICLSLLKFQFNIVLPDTTSSYVIMYQRCCRNEAVNIQNNNGTSIGATFYTTINPSFRANNSAVFKNYPPQIICINNNLYYDNSAVDPDADSLSYELCEAKDMKDKTNGNPTPSDLTAPPFPNIAYSFGFSSTNPMKGNPNITIDPKTGIITGKPTLMGRFVITVCCHEWRKGVIINTNRRDFQFEVTNCSKSVIADMPTFSDEPYVYIAECDTTLVQFRNNSKGGFAYHWDFGVDTSITDTSNLFEPTFNYPDTGTYKVRLIVNPGSTCQDSIFRYVKVYPKFIANYTYAGLLCPNEPIQFTDSTWGSLAMPNRWRWNYGDLGVDTIQNPVHAFKPGVYNVQMVAKNSFGCSDTSIQKINIKPVVVRTTADTIVMKNVNVNIFSSGASSYIWNPTLYMNDPTICCPTFNFPDTGRYSYTIRATTTEGCTNIDTINFIVVGSPVLFVPNAFSPNGDGINDILKIIQGGYGKLNYFRVFNRWGQQIFYSVNLNQMWDGTFNGKECTQDTYFWTASAYNILGQTVQIQGDVILMR